MRIALVTPEQHGSLVDLLCELHTHHLAPTPVDRDLVEVHLRDVLLRPDAPARLVVASTEPGGDVVGLAALVLLDSILDPSPAGRRQCVLKELYVRASHRSEGVGAALVQWSASWARDHGCGRMDWNVQAANTAGIAFYERLGGQRVADRLSYRLTLV